jgi:hypothetical protein
MSLWKREIGLWLLQKDEHPAAIERFISKIMVKDAW